MVEQSARLVFWAGKNYVFEALAVLVFALVCWQDGQPFLAGLCVGVGGTLLARAAIEAALRHSESE